MNNILVFLHGRGFDEDSHKDFCEKLAEKYRASLYSFNAPLIYKNGFSWFDKTEKDGKRIAEVKSYFQAVDFVCQKINSLNVPLQNIILCGHSQGGNMAVAVGLRLPLKKVISLCGDWPQNIEVELPQKTKNIIWMEAGKDKYLSVERKNSYHRLLEKGVNLDYILDEKSEHCVFSEDLLQKL